LLALTAVTLVLGGIRLIRTRRDVYSIVFLIVALVTLVSTIPTVYGAVFSPVVQFVQAIATGGMRGLLLGAALGIVLTGMRIILGIDRPHSGG
jgi:hypothetical protein